MMLVFLTFLFGSTYNGDLLFTVLFVVVFVTIIVVARTYSIYFCYWMEEALGVTAIEYDNSTELKAIREILVVMPGVLVENMTNDYKYFEGYRLNEKIKCPSYSQPAAPVDPKTIGRFICFIVWVPVITTAVLYGGWGAIMWGYHGTTMSVEDGSLPGSVLILINFLFIGCFFHRKIMSDFGLVSPSELANGSHKTPTDPNRTGSQEV